MACCAGSEEDAMPPARSIASALLLFTGVAHLLYWLVGADAAQGPGMAVFGGIYFALGLLLRRPGRWPLFLAIVLPALGGLGGAGQLRESFDAILALFVAIDVAAVLCCLSLVVPRSRA
jgi:hypothetical protein